jgi:hypothetical protein
VALVVLGVLQDPAEQAVQEPLETTPLDFH